MSENTKPLNIDMHCHILPLLDLCRYASMASCALTAIADLARSRPDFRRHLDDASSDLAELADYGGGATAASGIWIAMDLLRHYDEIPCALAPSGAETKERAAP